MKQCAVLWINPDGSETPQRQALERIGFSIEETRDWPANDMILNFHVVVVVVRDMRNICMVAARLRMKPHFGRRILVALVPDAATPQEQRSAVGSGFDDVVSVNADGRVLIARVIRRLRAVPEYRCFLPERSGRAA